MSDYETEKYDYRHEVDGKAGILTQCYESGSLWVSDDQNDFRFLDGVYPKSKVMSASVSGTYDSAHFPECTLDTQVNDWCICDRLRACEERVLDAAEAAIADIAGQDYDESYMALRAAVAAVRALKEKP